MYYYEFDFLKNIFHKDDFSISVFGSLYGLCAWALGFQWNIMWLDTFALLPIVVLGTVYLIRDKKFVLYTLSLFLSIYSNYYIGFFVCIFVFLLFFVYQICRWRGIKRFFADLFRIAFFSVLAIGMTAILELPALAALQTTQSSVNQFPTEFRLNIAKENTWKGLLDAMRQVAGNMSGGVDLNFKEGLPNIYCGIATIMLTFLYLMGKVIKLRDKICAVALLLFFNVSFIIRQLDYIWHGFHFTNMIPYRFSFLYSFVMLYMAYRAWLMRKQFTPLHIVIAGGFTLLIMSCSDQSKEPVFLAYNLVFLAVYMGIMVYGSFRKKLPEDADAERMIRNSQAISRRRYIAKIVCLFVVAAEMIVNLVCFGLAFNGTSVSNYPKGTEESASMIRYMHEREEHTLFFRAETTHSQTLNDGALNGYNGISAFTSSANVKVTEFMKALGYGAKNTYNRYCYEEASPVSNLFLGIKYMIERDGKDKSSTYFNDLHYYGDTHLLENNAYLPLGFLANSELADLEFNTDVGMFGLQNKLFTAATGVDKSVWRILGGEHLTITGTDVTITNSTTSGYCAYEDGVSGSFVTFRYDVDQNGFMVVNLNLPKRNKTHIYVNGIELYNESMSLPQMLAVGEVHEGDVVEIRLDCPAGEKGTMTLTNGILYASRFWQGYDVLKASTLELTEFENTYVAGTIDCNRDGLLYTSIPQNGNWTAKVDGAPAEIVLVGDCMIGLHLTEGTHTVEFEYRNAAFEVGAMITLVCALIFGWLVWSVYQPRKPRGKYVK